MGKVLTTDNEDSVKALRFSNKRKEAQLLLDKSGDVKIVVDRKEIFSVNELDSVVSDLSKTTSESISYSYLTKSLSNMKQLRYRNLEGNLFLPIEDYPGRTLPIETPITYIGELGNNTFLLNNVPYIKDLFVNPTNWLVTAASDPNNGKRVIKSEWLGNYTYEGTPYINCVKVELNGVPSLFSLGENAQFVSFNNYGINIRFNQAFPRGVYGRNRTTNVGAGWKDSKGNYYGIVTCEYTGNTVFNRFKLKVHKTTDPMKGEWVPLDKSTNGDFDSIIPSPYVATSGTMGVYKLPGNDGVYVTCIGLKTSDTSGGAVYGTVKAIGFILFNEDLTYKRLVIADISQYTFENSLFYDAYMSSAYYKGKYYITLQDGAYNLGKRQLLVADKLEGPYTYDSTVFDYTDERLTCPGSPFGYSIANAQLYVFNNELYMMSSGSGGYYSPSIDANHELWLFKYNDSSKTWNWLPSPIMCPFYSDTEFRELGDLSWGDDHLGVINPHFIEGNKLWFGFCATSTSGYTSSYGYWDLTKIF